MKRFRKLAARVTVQGGSCAPPFAPPEAAPKVSTHQARIQTGQQQTNRRRARLHAMGGILSLVFLIMAGRAVEVAVFNADDGPIMGSQTAVATARRASILDRDGEILATTLDFYSVYANPNHVWDPVSTAEQLAGVLPHLDVPRLIKRLSNRRLRHVPIADGLSPRTRQAIHLLGLPGVDFQKEPGRIYPKRRAAAHVVGYVDGQMSGVAGAERAFDAELSEGDRPIRLSIDLTAQHRVESILRTRMAKHRAAGASAVLMRVGTGEIIAAVSLPDFDPNRFDAARAPGSDIHPLFNQTVQGVYELGSVFKPLSLAAGLETGLVAMDDIFDASTPVRIGGHQISDYRGEGRPLTAREMVLHSSNIASARMADHMGGDALLGFYRDLRLFEASPIELLETAEPNAPRRWGRIQVMTASYGHGFQVSPLALTAAYATLANGGVYTLPTLRPIAPDETVVGVPVMQPNVAAQVLGVMRENVVRSQTGSADIEGLAVAGKTGTAERVIGGRYADDSRFNTFVAVFPFDDPQYVLTVTMDRPRPTEDTYGYATAGWTAMPAAGAIMQALAGILHIDRHDTDPQAQVSVVAKLFSPRSPIRAPAEEPAELFDVADENQR